MRKLLFLIPAFIISSSSMSMPNCFCKKELLKLRKHNANLIKWDEKLETCREKTKQDRSVSCFFEIKISAYMSRKVDKWQYKLRICEELDDSTIYRNSTEGCGYLHDKWEAKG
tara:strand:+ start:3173 stop:3511 length:339 start_codon:yes stop_codon:yes gene_type:complete